MKVCHDDGEIQLLGGSDVYSESVLALLRRTLSSFFIQVNHEFDLTIRLHGPSQLVAIVDTVRTDFIFSGFGLPGLLLHDSLFGAVTNDDIVLVYGDLRKFRHFVRIDRKLDGFASLIEAWSLGELGGESIL